MIKWTWLIKSNATWDNKTGEDVSRASDSEIFVFVVSSASHANSENEVLTPGRKFEPLWIF